MGIDLYSYTHVLCAGGLLSLKLFKLQSTVTYTPIYDIKYRPTFPCFKEYVPASFILGFNVQAPASLFVASALEV